MRTFTQFAKLYWIAAWLYRRTFARHQKVILVVGSFGKTTTTRAIQTALGVSSEVTSKNYNYQGLIAWNFMRLPRSQSFVVLEVGIKHPEDMVEFVSPLKPDAVVVTCIGDEHVYSFGTREGIREEKANAVRALSADGIAFLNGDDLNVRWMAEQTSARIVWYGYDSTNQYRGKNWELNWPALSMLRYSTAIGSGVLESQLIGQESSYALLAALAVAAEFDQPLSTAAKNLQGMTTTIGRLNRLLSPHGFWVIRDNFKATLATIHLAVNLVRDLPGASFWL